MQERLENEKIKLKGYKCPSCKLFGHKVLDCPKDPNIRGFQVLELAEEIERVEKIKKFKKQNQIVFAENSQRATNIL